MARVWNIIGGNFTHTTGGHTGRCGTHGKLPQNLQWSFDYESDISFYLDANMFSRIDEHPEHRKFGWLLESKSIKPNTYQQVKAGYERLFETYEAIFTHDQEILQLDERFRFTICCGFWVKDTAIHPKQKKVSAISSGKGMCEGHHWRNRFIAKHREEFDLFGNKYKHLKYKEMGLNEYMFSVAIENGSYATYFTEKILDCFATGTVPLYRGSPDIADFFNPGGIIFVDEGFSFDILNQDLYYDKMEAVKDNFERLQNYHCAEDFIFNTYREEFNWD